MVRPLDQWDISLRVFPKATTIASLVIEVAVSNCSFNYRAGNTFLCPKEKTVFTFIFPLANSKKQKSVVEELSDEILEHKLPQYFRLIG